MKKSLFQFFLPSISNLSRPALFLIQIVLAMTIVNSQTFASPSPTPTPTPGVCPTGQELGAYQCPKDELIQSAPGCLQITIAIAYPYPWHLEDCECTFQAPPNGSCNSPNFPNSPGATYPKPNEACPRPKSGGVFSTSEVFQHTYTTLAECVAENVKRCKTKCEQINPEKAEVGQYYCCRP